MAEARPAVGRAWVREQVATYAEFRPAPLPEVEGGEVLWVHGAEPAPSGPDPDGGDDAYDVADVAIGRLLESWSPLVLIVENDLSREGDRDWAWGGSEAPVMERGSSASIGGKVVHWLLIEPGGDHDVAEHLRSSASGYPTVANAVPASFAPRLGAKHWDRELAAEMAAATTAIVVSAFDNTGWLVWRRDR